MLSLLPALLIGFAAVMSSSAALIWSLRRKP